MDEQPTKRMIRSITDADVAQLLVELRHDIPSAELRFKTDSWLQRCIGLIVRPFNPRYMTHYTTVMGGKIWLPSREFLQRRSAAWLYALIQHEAVHLRDMRRFPVLFHVSYLLLLPTGITCRAYWEWRAYKASLAAEYAIEGAISDEYIEDIVERFAGPDYLYMWPFRTHIRRLARRERARIVRYGGSNRPRRPLFSDQTTSE